jgi:hypothetical protein
MVSSSEWQAFPTSGGRFDSEFHRFEERGRLGAAGKTRQKGKES